MAFTELELPGTGEDSSRGWGRADVVAVKPHTWARMDIRIYEVKASIRDFHGDIQSGKWRRYLQVAHRVFFAVPTGLLKRADVPDEAGLVVKGEKGWTTIKNARPHLPEKLSADTVLAMLYRGYEENREYRDLRLRMDFSPEGVVKGSKTIGYDIARKLAAKKDELEEPLQKLLEVVKQFAPGQGEPSSLDVKDLTMNLRGIIALTEEMAIHSHTVQRIASYLSSLSSRWWSEDRFTASRESVEKQLDKVRT